jgi:hypothetical protein
MWHHFWEAVRVVQLHVGRMDLQQWILVAVLAVLVGAFALRGNPARI